MHQLLKRAATLTGAFILHGCAMSPIFPGEYWSVVDDPQTQGIDAPALQRLSEAVAAGNTQSMMVVKDGQVLFSYGDTARTEGTYVASVRKSLLSMMYGPWVRRGTIDLDATLAELEVDDRQGLTAQERSATIRDLISARSGVYHPASNFSGIDEAGPRRGDHLPGEYFWYNNWDFNFAGLIFEQLTGKNIYRAFDEQLAGPLQLQDYDLAAHLEGGKTGDQEASLAPAYHFYLSTRDLARLGLLMLHEGEWAGTRIIPADWVRESTALVTPNVDMNPQDIRDSGFGYGYMWWVFSPQSFPAAFHGGYAARGHFGQYIVVMPQIDVVIAHKTMPVDYETPEEYEAINVTWDELRVLIDLLLDALPHIPD